MRYIRCWVDFGSDYTDKYPASTFCKEIDLDSTVLQMSESIASSHYVTFILCFKYTNTQKRSVADP
jgi:hypothetical protein